MNNNERTTANQTDLQQIWLQVATDIKIRKIENLVDLPEFHHLPNQLQHQLQNDFSNLNHDYKIFHNEQELTHFHVMLFNKEKDRYLAIYQEKKPSVTVRSILSTLGFTAVFVFIWHQLFKIVNGTQAQQLPSTDNNSAGATTVPGLNDLLSLVIGLVPSLFTYPYIQNWFSTRDSVYNKLIEGCMLKKLDSISNFQ